MQTLRSGKEFQAVFSQGKRYKAQSFTSAYLKQNKLDTQSHNPAKLAFVASKRLGNAVYRNRCKRRLRAAAQDMNAWTYDTDIILFATNRTHDCEYKVLCDELQAFLSTLQ